VGWLVSGFVEWEARRKGGGRRRTESGRERSKDDRRRAGCRRKGWIDSGKGEREKEEQGERTKEQ